MYHVRKEKMCLKMFLHLYNYCNMFVYLYELRNTYFVINEKFSEILLIIFIYRANLLWRTDLYLFQIAWCWSILFCVIIEYFSWYANNEEDISSLFVQFMLSFLVKNDNPCHRIKQDFKIIECSIHEFNLYFISQIYKEIVYIF